MLRTHLIVQEVLEMITKATGVSHHALLLVENHGEEGGYLGSVITNNPQVACLLQDALDRVEEGPSRSSNYAPLESDN